MLKDHSEEVAYEDGECGMKNLENTLSTGRLVRGPGWVMGWERGRTRRCWLKVVIPDPQKQSVLRPGADPTSARNGQAQES